MTETNAEQQLLQDLRLGKAAAFEQVYKNYYRMVANLIQKNSGSEEEIEDVFQETLFILVKKLRDKNFKLTAKLGTFLYSISRNLWMQRLQKKGKSPLVSMPEEDQEFIALDESELAVKKEHEKKHDLIATVLKDLKEDCQRIIIASFYKKMSHEEIATELDYSKQFVRVKLHRCMEGFRKKVKGHPDFQLL
jgi:RNA polymerase sigma factor (sigma-70 family)